MSSRSGPPVRVRAKEKRTQNTFLLVLRANLVDPLRGEAPTSEAWPAPLCMRRQAPAQRSAGRRAPVHRRSNSARRVMRRSAREHGGGREDASREPGTQGRGSRDAQGRVLRRDPRQLRRRVRTRSQLESRSTRAPEPSAQRPAATARRRSSCVGGPHAIGRRSAARGNWQRSAAMPRGKSVTQLGWRSTGQDKQSTRQRAW
ncbi:hypothetical protein ERJ75_000663100 [Trypanosoma vivax]|nr:hypothetical protein ERJ75_000663100 [Trypanosoma vivax]